MTYLCLAVAIAWLVFTLATTLNLLATPRLPGAADLNIGEGRPSVSVVIAARDEAARIEQTVQGLLAQQSIELELIVVDDRSTDATQDILARAAARDPRLSVLRVDELPECWLGKCHACWLGAKRARGEWLLFTDGDIHMRDDLVARAIAVAQRDAADHVTLWPGVNSKGILARASILAWGQCLAVYCPAARINRDRGRKGIGIGAFNLVRSEAYRAIGGHEPLRLEVVDDIKLGLLLRRAGFRQRLYAGFNDLEAEWAQSSLAVIRAVEKNWFARLDFSVVKSAACLTILSAMWLVGLAGPLLDGYAGWAALAGFLSPIVPALIQTRLTGWPWYVAIPAPLGFAMFILAGVHSTAKTLLQGGIRWRETFYPLAMLRSGLVK